MEGDWITLDEAAELLGIDRSNVFRRAKRGDFGPIRPIGGSEQRPSIILVSSAAVAALAARQAS